jgi:crotonobetainyl-CoA:carnitine CoA-transferase CaiB-like acyl-CoA transferase
LSALAGVRVLDLSSGLAGPMVGMWFSDFGADVVKVEPPRGDWARSLPGFIAWNRGKRSVVADSSVAVDRERVRAFASTADLVIGDSRSLAEFGLTNPDFGASAPRVVLLRVDPYEADPPWCTDRESPDLVMAASGLALVQSSTHGTPVHLVSPVLSYVHGIWASACAVAALIERERSGLGQVVAVNGMHGFLVAGTMMIAFNPHQPATPRRWGSVGLNPTYTHFLASDGLRFFVAALTPKFQRRLLDAIGLVHLLDDSRAEGDIRKLMGLPNRAWVRAELARAFAAAPRAEWLRRLKDAGVPSGPLLTRDEWFASEQVRAIGMRQTITDPRLGDIDLAGVPIVLTRTPGSPSGPAPALGEHTDSAYPWPPVERPEPRPCEAAVAGAGKGPLDGITVLSLGTFVAGPFGPFLLGELGAEVIKVESLEGDPFRVQAFYQNRGMKSLSIDLADPEGKAAFGQIVSTSDVLVENFRPGAGTKLGVDHESLLCYNPKILSLSVTGFGEGGPLSRELAFDALLAAMGGLQAAQGGNDEPVMLSLAINDLTTGSLSALAATVGLFERARSGLGQRMWSSIAGATVFLQSADVLRYDGRPPAPVGGADFGGPSHTDCFYEVVGGWVRVHAEAFDSAALASAGLIKDPDASETEAAAELAVSLKVLTRADAARALNGAGVPAAEVRTINELPSDERLMDGELLHAHLDSGGNVSYYTAGRYAKFSRTQRHDVLTAPGLGEHSVAVLADADVAQEQIESLLRDGVIKVSPPVDWTISPPYR